MSTTLRRIIASAAFGISALVLACIAFIVLPIYGAFMVVWLHVPVGEVLVTVGPLTLLFAIGAYATFRASRRARRAGGM